MAVTGPPREIREVRRRQLQRALPFHRRTTADVWREIRLAPSARWSRHGPRLRTHGTFRHGVGHVAQKQLFDRALIYEATACLLTPMLESARRQTNVRTLRDAGMDDS